jgi:cardiolipin synthase (CMP-forming)
MNQKTINNQILLNRKKRTNVSIALTIIWLLCISFYYLFISFFKIPTVYSILIIASETLLCIFMWAFFMIKIDWLKDMTTAKEIMHLNISNILSALRFSLVPLLITMIGLLTYIDGNFIYKIFIFTFGVIVCMTDIFDGILARKFNEVTKLGMVLDPVGDFLMIICFSILIFSNKIIEWWFFALILIRIPGLVVVAVFLMTLDIKFKLKTTILGRATIFYILSHLGVSTIKLLLNLHNPLYDQFLFVTQIIGSILIVLSSAEKIKHLTDYLRNQEKLKLSKDNIQF